MGAIVLPDNYGHLADSLGDIAGAVAHAINPNHDFQVAMRDAMAKNPKLYQQLVDIEHTSPGTMEAMGFGKDLARVAAKGQSSVQSQIENQIAKSKELQEGLSPDQITSAISTAATGKTPGEIAHDKLIQQQSEGASKILSPTLSDGSTNPLYNKDVADEANFHYATGMSKVEFQQSMLQEKAMKDAVNTDLSGRNMGQDVSDFVDSLETKGAKGGIDNKVLNAYENTPGMSTAWRQMIALEMQKRSLDFQYKKAAGERDRNDEKDAEKDARRLVITSHGAFDFNTAKKYLMGDSDTVRRLGELAAGTGKPMQAGEEDLYRAAQYNRTGEESNFESARKDVIGEINSSMADFRKAPGDSKLVPAAMLNQSLSKLSALANDKNPLSVTYNEGKVHYMQGGKELNEPTFFQKMSKLFSGQPANNAVDPGNVNHALHDVLGAKDRNAALAKLKETDIDVYNEVVKQLNK